MVETTAPMITSPHQLVAMRPRALVRRSSSGPPQSPVCGLAAATFNLACHCFAGSPGSRSGAGSRCRRPHYLAMTDRVTGRARQGARFRPRRESLRNRGKDRISTCRIGLFRDSAYVHHRAVRPSNPRLCRNRAGSQSRTVSKFFHWAGLSQKRIAQVVCIQLAALKKLVRLHDVLYLEQS